MYLLENFLQKAATTIQLQEGKETLLFETEERDQLKENGDLLQLCIVLCIRIQMNADKQPLVQLAFNGIPGLSTTTAQKSRSTHSHKNSMEWNNAFFT